MTEYIGLTLLTETRVNIGQYGGHSEVLVPIMAVFCKCQTDTMSTGGKSYGQPHVVAERCYVATPCYVIFVGIFSTYSPRSSINFLVRCSNFCKPLNKKSQKSLRQQLPTRRKKNCELSIFFFNPGNSW